MHDLALTKYIGPTRRSGYTMTLGYTAIFFCIHKGKITYEHRVPRLRTAVLSLGTMHANGLSHGQIPSTNINVLS